MTWSIAARDPATGALAVAVATCNFAVGSIVPFVRAGVGAVATQSVANRYLGPAVLDHLEAGLAPKAAIKRSLASDDWRSVRQLHAVDAKGRTAAWTGENCVPWCGSLAGQEASFAGNMLANERVVAATAEAFAANANLELPERLMAAMHAGEAAGGDRRGRQSAGMMVVTTEDFADIDLRVDDHTEPLIELDRLLAVFRRQIAHTVAARPSRAHPSGIFDLDAFQESWRARGVDSPRR
jgi:uncharacterized Ntn-hydrolase superfamily protein